LIVPEGAFGDSVIAALLGVVDRIRVDQPFAEPAPFMSALVDNAAADAILAGQERMIAAGAVVLRRSERIAEGKPLLTPGLLDVTDQSDREDREYFGPLLQLIRVPDFDAALVEANATRFGLSAGLIGGNEEDYARFQDEIRAGVVNWNRPTTGAASSAPFGGVGVSGNHRPSAYYAADYCAYPVASLEADTASFEITTGLSQ
jgi:succinylglutamic semialdehyde dehydrogenase